ncbi:MAG TPA: hypothetical protein VFY79_01285 [Dehalococcoidia bacterium]|nr:hypothetical protein [Dehalococcoidia bacterium]
MSRLFFETEPEGDGPGFIGATDVLVYFLSLAFSTRYGAQHDLARLALVLRGTYKIDLEPLLTFADRDIEVEADARELARVWQDAGPLAETLRNVNEALASGDEEIDAIVREAPGLRERLVELQAMAEAAAARGARVRLSFEL